MVSLSPLNTLSSVPQDTIHRESKSDPPHGIGWTYLKDSIHSLVDVDMNLSISMCVMFLPST